MSALNWGRTHRFAPTKMNHPPIYIKQVEVGMMRNLKYLIGDPGTKECAYIDPAWEVDRLLKIAKADGYQVKKILLTHNHFDHIEGVEKVVGETGAEIYIHSLDEKPVRKGSGKIVSLSHGMEFKIGNLLVNALKKKKKKKKNTNQNKYT